MNMKTLILTGWGWLDYACAAAVLSRSCPRADIMGVSTRRLPEYLTEIAKEIAKAGYGQIVILGVGLIGNPEQLRDAAQKLVDRGVELSWLSKRDFPPNLPGELRKLLTIKVDEDKYLTEIAAEWGKVPGEDLLPLAKEDDKLPPALCPYQELLKAAMYVHRNYQDETAYGEAIRLLAKRTDEKEWPVRICQMAEDYRHYGDRELLGRSEQMVALRKRIKQAAGHDRARVLILGESGTGKEAVALQIHNQSTRRSEPYVCFNCASVNPGLLESRFFGHEKGAFTGATEMKRGLFEQANGGTLFLDEIGELPLEAQGILLRALEVERIIRVGGKDPIDVNVRIITATNRDLAAQVREHKFREDLFHRLNVVQIRTPPLREHKEDIRQIAEDYWWEQHRPRLGAEQVRAAVGGAGGAGRGEQHRPRLDAEQMAALMQYDYPGNVRELRNLLERARVLDIKDFSALIEEHRQSTRSLYQADTTPETDDAPKADTAPAPISDNLEEATRRHVRQVYEKFNHNIFQSAKALGITRPTVRKYLDGKDGGKPRRKKSKPGATGAD